MGKLNDLAALGQAVWLDFVEKKFLAEGKLQKMVDEDRYCADVLTQIASVQEALRAVGRELMRNHLRHCATAAIRGDDAAAAERVYDEILTLMDRAAR